MIYTALFILAFLVVLGAPIFLGSFRPRYWFGLETAVFLLFALFCLTRAFRSRLFDPKLRVMYLFIAGWLIWPLIQLIPLPQGVIALVSAKSLEVFRLTYPDSSFLSISMQKFATADEFLKRLMCACMFTLMLFLPAKRGHLKVAIFMLAAFALFHGFYVFVQYAADPEVVIRSTYTNRNHFALYIAMSMSVLIGYSLSILNESGGRGVDLLVNGQMMGVFGVILVLVTVPVFTLSKGATVSLVSGMVITWLLLRDSRGARESNRGHLIFVIVLFAAAGSMVILGVSDLFSRFNVAGIFGDERWLQWLDSLRLARDYWLTGSGGGTYEYVFPAYKSAEYRALLYHHVHNDYIEALTNDGVIGLALLLGIFLLWLVTLRKLYLARRDPFLKGVTFGLCLAVTTGMVHAFFDFNLQVPANALMLFALMGLGLGTITINRERSSRVLYER
ncbi:O-antigen ligase family protein [Pseudomonadota bacterium]